MFLLIVAVVVLFEPLSLPKMYSNSENNKENIN